MGRAFNKGLYKEDKEEQLLKRLKNIEDKNKEQLNDIAYQGEKELDAFEKQRKEHFKAINKQEN